MNASDETRGGAQAPAKAPTQAPEPAITVIVAVYNCEQYVRACLESLKAQTLPDFECIVVDDASTDGSVRAVRDCVADDARFQLVQLAENGGPGAARNAALDRARGTYAMYVDADDLLAPDALEKIVARMWVQQLDELYFSARSFFDDPSVVEVLDEDFAGREPFEGVATGCELFTFFSDRNQYFAQGALRAVRRQMLVDAGIRFPEGIIHEDVLFGFCILAASQRSSFLNEPLYLRRQRAGSIMGASRRSVENVLGHSVCVSQVRAWMREHAGQLDDGFMQAAGREVGLWCQRIAADWDGQLTQAERDAFLAGLAGEQRKEFLFDTLGAGQASERAAAEWRESQTYKLGDAIAKVPRAARLKLRGIRKRGPGDPRP